MPCYARYSAPTQNPEDATSSLEGIGSILLVAGQSDEDNPYKKTTAIQVGGCYSVAIGGAGQAASSETRQSRGARVSARHGVGRLLRPSHDLLDAGAVPAEAART